MHNASKKIFRVSAGFIFACIFFYSGGFLDPSHSQASAPTSGLIGYWNFDEGSGASAADSSENGNTGSLVNGPTWTTGKVGSGSLFFDGTNDTVNAGSATSLDDIQNQGGGGMTVAFWINPSSNTFNYVLSKGMHSNASGSWEITKSSQTNPARLGFFKSGVTNLSVSWNSALTTGTWQHIILTWGGTMASSSVSAYKNGQLLSGKGGTDGSSAYSDAANNFYIGSSNGTSGYADVGLDDLRIYNRILSAQEILDVYNDTGVTPLPDTTSPTVSITSPSSGATVSGNTTITANASDETGLYSVQFKLDGSNLGPAVTIAPYTYSWDTTIATNGSYTLTAVATDTSNNQTTSASVSLTVNNQASPPPDTTAPSIPSNLIATVISSSAINLSWNASTDNVTVTGYKIYRNGSQIGTSASTSYSDSGLSPNTTYSYAVSAYDVAGNNSAQSSTASAATQAISGNRVDLLSSSGSILNTYVTIQACANVATAGQTCLVYVGTYDERVTPANSGTAGNVITYKAQTGCVSNNGATITASCPKVRAFSFTGKNYITIQGLEFTSQGMSNDAVRLLSFSTADHITFANNYVHDTAPPYACVNAGVQSTNIVFRGNNVKRCGEAMDVYATIRGPYNIQAGVNDKISLSVQGGAAQTVTLTPGTGRTAIQLASDVNTQLGGGPATGPVWAVGASNNSFSIRSNTRGPGSTIEVLSVANSAYATLGMSLGFGTMTGHNAAFGATGSIPPSVTDWLIENNVLSYVGDYLTPGSGSRLVYRNNQLGPSGIYNNDHIDGVQQGGFSQGLMEGNMSVDNNNSDNHFYLNQGTGDLWIVRSNSTCRTRGDVAQGAYPTGFPDHLYFYNNTFYDNATYMYGGHDVQVNAIYSPNNVSINNIFYKSTAVGYPIYTTSNGGGIVKDYDLWYMVANPGEVHGVNADPLVADPVNCNFSLTSSSPARDAGGALTQVASGDAGSGTTLLVNDAHFFQDGWAGVNADWIAVGSTSNTAQIVSIDYSTNAVTLNNSLSRSSGQPVYLYKNSSGTQIFYGSAPDIGAYEYINAVPSDTTVPSIPASLTATAISSSAIDLSWAASTDNVAVAGYKVYRGGVQIGTSATNSYSDTGLSASTSYSYTVSAYDAAGNNSSQSSSASAVTSPILPAISNLVGSNTTATSTTISWQTNVLTNGQIFYGLTSAYGSSSALLDNNPKTTSHITTLSNLSSSTTYHFKVTSVDAYNSSTSSPDFTFTTLSLPPPAAPNITSFTANPNSLTSGETAGLLWTIGGNPTSVTINQGIGSVLGLSSYSVSPATTTTYTLTALNSGGTATAQVTIVVNASTATGIVAPTIDSFIATPSSIAQGNSAVLSFIVSGNPMPTLAIDNSIGNVSGLTSKTIYPSQNTTYTLTASNSAGTATAQVTVNVTVVSTTSGNGSSLGSNGSSGSSATSTVTVYIPATATPSSITVPGTTTPAASGNVLKLINSNGTYYLIKDGQLYGVTSPGILFSYGFDFKDAKIPTGQDLSLPKASLLLPGGGHLVKSSSDPTVYLISTGQRYAFTSAAVFRSLGFSFNNVLLVTNPELQLLPKALDINTSQIPHHPGVNINDHGTIYWLGPDGQKHGYPSLAIYNSWHKDNDFTQVVPANSFDQALPVGSLVMERVME